ncbi:AGE family epimerase/isomerase [Cyclobacterium sp. 1_MG-2023]|uniref:AGE family epimerase/isomerase n=1 Tax=Cyclobacterium sp. 1_MG-2023 TaxID=3062681 RepID=UPI0026E419F9|nr:AGE family epimerase/isomerase [Cyclobacterium sp. 1_MG-2023]MDO6436986.1 AGE family epimerase/isomerase [Cyclobacterium sp. 1_MG-2023]
MNRLTIVLFFISCLGQTIVAQTSERLKLADEIEFSINNELINLWYPKAYDIIYGGYISSFDAAFNPTENQDKMIVSQARHLWTLSKMIERNPETKHYYDGAKLGFTFLRDKFWDKENGGFHTLLNREGKVKSSGIGAKTAYGNAFGIYGLAAYYKVSANPEVLELAKKAFYWLEEHSYDPQFGGYFQSLALDGTVLKRDSNTASTATIGYKDQNSSIHLLEAFTELYGVWKDPLLKKRTIELLAIIRDKVVQKEGYLQLFLYPDWKPVSFRDKGRVAIDKHHSIDHVSYGHDIETAYLMMEASHVLGLQEDYQTWKIGKRMVDHSLRYGWDNKVGGFYDGGYYFAGESKPELIKDTKNWWAQAEGLNSLLIMADLYPNDSLNYFGKFQVQWDYIQRYLIDHENGEWYPGGLDKQPELKNARKGQIWKTAYHNFRALNNCEQKLRDPSHLALTIKKGEKGH